MMVVIYDLWQVVDQKSLIPLLKIRKSNGNYLIPYSKSHIGFSLVSWYPQKLEKNRIIIKVYYLKLRLV